MQFVIGSTRWRKGWLEAVYFVTQLACAGTMLGGKTAGKSGGVASPWPCDACSTTLVSRFVSSEQAPLLDAN